MVSRQTLHNRQRSIEALRERAAAAPIVVGYDAAIEKFFVCWTEDPDTVLIAARHEVVAAYIDGFVRAWINRPRPMADEQTPRVLKHGTGYDLVVQGHAFDPNAGGRSTLVLGIRCHTCQRVSFHPKDVTERYCGACHAFHETHLLDHEG